MSPISLAIMETDRERKGGERERERKGEREGRETETEIREGRMISKGQRG